jgi:hypothetical protein
LHPSFFLSYALAVTKKGGFQMAGSEVGKLTLTVEPEALREAIAQGRLLELADKLATQAAAQISAQLVDHVAKAALAPKGLESAASISFAYALEGGDYGTRPPRPHWRVVNIDAISEGGIRQVVVAGSSETKA